jgi:signal transduction histidine kinase
MKDPYTTNPLDELKNALEELSQQSLPIHTHNLIQNTRSRLDHFKNSSSYETQDSRLAALYQISKSMGFSLDQDKALNQVMDVIIELTGAERGFLTLIDSATGELRLRAARNIEGQNLYSDDMEVSRTVIQSVIDSEEGVVTTDAQTDPRFAGQQSVVFHSLKSILCAPLRSSGKIMGVIYIENRAQSGIFTSDDLDLLNAFATQAAVAIDNARLYTRTDQALSARIGELETLSKIDRELNAELDLGRALEITRRWAIKGTSADECWIGLSDEETGQLELIVAPEEEERKPSEQVIDTISKRTETQEISGDKYKYLAAPLLHSDELQGAIIVTGISELQSDEKEFLSRLAGRASAAIANARLFQAVQNANQSKSQFVSTVTHELRIPLTSIKGYTDLIRKGVVGEVSDQQINFLDVIQTNVERMSRLISDLSDISRIERGKLHLDPVSLSIHPYVEETFDSLKHGIDEKKQSLTSSFPETLPNVIADPNRLVQILTNLVSNAVKYTPKGGKISVSASQFNGFVRVEVRDTGFGISDEDQAKLFTQFFRSESQSIREQTGWGLGLNVTKKLVEIMGGEIGFNSILDKGSVFWFTLPVA